MIAGAGGRFPRWGRGNVGEGTTSGRWQRAAGELRGAAMRLRHAWLLDFDPLDDFDAHGRGTVEEPLDFGGAEWAVVDAGVVDPAGEIEDRSTHCRGGRGLCCRPDYRLMEAVVEAFARWTPSM